MTIRFMLAAFVLLQFVGLVHSEQSASRPEETARDYLEAFIE